jgi:RNA polymerase sigma-70 factor (ECF subfamily)
VGGGQERRRRARQQLATGGAILRVLLSRVTRLGVEATLDEIEDALVVETPHRPDGARTRRWMPGRPHCIVVSVDDELQAAFARARAAWPGVAMSWERFREVAARHLPDADPGHLADLYLASACADGDATAWQLLDHHLLSAIPVLLRRIDASAAFGDEVRQRLRTRLAVSPSGGSGTIGDYAGRGALKSWLHISATRIALKLKREQHREDEVGDSEADRILATPDPELAFIKHRAREDFRLAFQAALADLPARERYLLRLHYLDRLTLAQIGALEQLDKSTISRRLESARQTLLDETTRLLRERLQLETSELDSLFGLIASQLDVSIEAFLKPR